MGRLRNNYYSMMKHCRGVPVSNSAESRAIRRSIGCRWPPVFLPFCPSFDWALPVCLSCFLPVCLSFLPGAQQYLSVCMPAFFLSVCLPLSLPDSLFRFCLSVCPSALSPECCARTPPPPPPPPPLVPRAALVSSRQQLNGMFSLYTEI